MSYVFAGTNDSKLRRAIEEARDRAHQIVDKTEDGLRGTGETADAALSAPAELQSILKEEKAAGHIEGPLRSLEHTAVDKVHNVEEYIK